MLVSYILIPRYRTIASCGTVKYATRYNHAVAWDLIFQSVV